MTRVALAILPLLVHSLRAQDAPVNVPLDSVLLQGAGATWYEAEVFGQSPGAVGVDADAPAGSPRPVENGTVENGTVENGTVENGTVENGTVENGTVENGTVENGTVENGTVDSMGDPLPDDLTGRGLLDFRDPYPLAEFHLQLPTASPPGLRQGETAGLVQFEWANTSAEATNFLVDAETYTLRLGFWHALRRHLYLGVETAVQGRDGGILDAFIDDFHQTLGISVSERDDRPRDAYDVVVVDSGGALHEFDRGFGLGNTALKAHWIFSEGSDDDWWPTLALQPQVYLPTSTSGFGARGVDLGLALTAQKKVTDYLYLYTAGGGTFLTDPTTYGLRYEELNYQVTAGLEAFLWWDSLSLALQYTHYSALLKNADRLDRGRNYVGGAIKHRIHPRVELIWGFMENLPPLKITTDATFTMGCEFRF